MGKFSFIIGFIVLILLLAINKFNNFFSDLHITTNNEGMQIANFSGPSDTKGSGISNISLD